MHDDEYDKGGDKGVRKQADKALFRRCFRLIYDREESPWMMIWLALNALLYYISVRTFGKYFFNNKK